MGDWKGEPAMNPGRMGIHFYLPWRRAMQGEDHTITYTQEDSWGHGLWTLRLVPSGND